MSGEISVQKPLLQPSLPIQITIVVDCVVFAVLPALMSWGLAVGFMFWLSPFALIPVFFAGVIGALLVSLWASGVGFVAFVAWDGSSIGRTILLITAVIGIFFNVIGVLFWNRYSRYGTDTATLFLISHFLGGVAIVALNSWAFFNKSARKFFVK